MTIHTATKLTGLTATTLRRYTDEGKLPDNRTKGGWRAFRVADLGFPLQEQQSGGEKVVLYARVSTAAQRSDGDLDRQVEKLREAAKARDAMVVAEITDVASGLSEKRQGLRKVMKLASEGKVNTVLISHRDRLARIGAGYLEAIFALNGCEVVCVSEDEALGDSAESELVRDLLAIMTSFTARLHGERGNRARKAARIAKEELKCK